MGAAFLFALLWALLNRLLQRFRIFNYRRKVRLFSTRKQQFYYNYCSHSGYFILILPITKVLVFVNQNLRIAVGFDVATIHPFRVERHCNVALAVHGNQAAVATHLAYLINSSLGSLR